MVYRRAYMKLCHQFIQFSPAFGNIRYRRWPQMIIEWWRVSWKSSQWKALLSFRGVDELLTACTVSIVRFTWKILYKISAHNAVEYSWVSWKSQWKPWSTEGRIWSFAINLCSFLPRLVIFGTGDDHKWLLSGGDFRENRRSDKSYFPLGV